MRDFAEAFFDIFKLIGITSSALALLNLVSHLFHFDLVGFLALWAQAMRLFFHPAFDWLFGWFDIELSEFVKDMLTLYLLVGGTMGRTVGGVLARAFGSDKVKIHGRDFQVDADAHGFGYFLGTLMTYILIWPIKLIDVIKQPIVAQKRSKWLIFFETGGTHFRTYEASHKEDIIAENEYVCDLRTVLMLQILAVCLQTVGLIGINGQISGLNFWSTLIGLFI